MACRTDEAFLSGNGGQSQDRTLGRLATFDRGGKLLDVVGTNSHRLVSAV